MSRSARPDHAGRVRRATRWVRSRHGRTTCAARPSAAGRAVGPGRPPARVRPCPPRSSSRSTSGVRQSSARSTSTVGRALSSRALTSLRPSYAQIDARGRAPAAVLPHVRTPTDISNRRSSPRNVVHRLPGWMTTCGVGRGRRRRTRSARRRGPARRRRSAARRSSRRVGHDDRARPRSCRSASAARRPGCASTTAGPGTVAARRPRVHAPRRAVRRVRPCPQL